MLELGCGAGRVTRSLVGLAASVEAIDISSTMVSYCRDTIPQGDFSVGDLSDLSAYETGAFAAVVASFVCSTSSTTMSDDTRCEKARGF